MSNWCNNVVEIAHDDPKMIQKFVKSYNEDKVCETFTPELKNLYWSDWVISNDNDTDVDFDIGRSDNYGSDDDGTDFDVVEVDINSTEVGVWFDTPDGPPIELYEYLTEKLGFRIHAEYYSFGRDYFGVFDNVLFKNEEKKYFEDIINLKTILDAKSYIPNIYDMIKDELEDLINDEEDEEQRKLYRGE